MKRLYIIKYISIVYGLHSYESEEEVILYYQHNERDKFIEKFLELQNKYHIKHLECFYVTEFNKIDDMNKIIDAI